jgi:hypothetical protein
MKQGIGILSGASLALVATFAACSASAQESYFRTPVPAPSRAFELQLSGGYTQGFGNIFPGHSILSAAGAGVGLTAAVGYRATPVMSLEIEGQYQAYSSGNVGTSQGLDTNIGVTLHGRPFHRGDPWLRLATGYRWVWVSDVITGRFGGLALSGTVGFSGWDIINARIGYDIRSSGNVAWAPFVGANVQTFIWANTTPMSTAQWGTYIYAGLQARFDAGGFRSQVASTRGEHDAD